MDISQNELQEIVQSVVRNVLSKIDTNNADSMFRNKGDFGVFEDMDDAINAAYTAFLSFRERSIQCRKKYIDAVRKMALEHKEELARMTVEETKMGRVEHKIAKFVNAANNSPGVEYLQPQSWSGKNGLAIDEYSPFGVIGNITPSTHPGPTMINNIIIQLAAGNTIAFNPHPSAKGVNAKVIQLANKYMTEVGAPENLVTCVKNPTLESAEILFNHSAIELLSVTGGPGMVNMAMKTAKKVIAAGPGNPPVLIDETADLKLAAEEITMSASYDNNILCIAEKEIFVVEEVFDAFMNAMDDAGNYRLTKEQINLLAQKALDKKNNEYFINRDYVGKNANILANTLNLSISEDVPLLYGETDKNHPFVTAEQMTSCLPIIRVGNFNEGINAALEAEHGFKHTASIYTKDMGRATLFTKKLDCDVHVINGGTLRGDGGDLGEGYFSHTIATPTGEGICTPLDFTRKRRIMTYNAFRFV